MRFILAIFAFIVATALLAAGIAQRTVLMPPSSVTSTVSMEGAEPYIVIDEDVLKSHDGNQTLTISGPGVVFAAYGRSADVHAWLAGSPYRTLAYDEDGETLGYESVPADPAAAANVESGSSNPAGSDLWYEQYSSEQLMVRSLSLPPGYSVIVAADGTEPAPPVVSISWPLSTATPLAGPLFVAGGVALLLGLVFLLLGLRHMKRQRGPRRRPPAALSEGKKSRRKSVQAGPSSSRRAITKSFTALVPLSLASALVLSGCSPEYWPQSAPEAEATATPTPTPSAGQETADTPPEPVVTTQQADRIVADVSATAAAADAAGNAELLTPRFAGPAYDIRAAGYTIKSRYPEYVSQPAIPAGPPSVVLPQAARSWPRTVFTIVQNPSDPNAPSLAMMLQQQSPRSNYKASYVIALEPGTTLPPVASAAVGTSRLGPDTKLLTMTPAETKAAYADVLVNGQSSASFGLFDTANDTLMSQVGADNKAARKAGLPSTAVLEFGSAEAPGPNIALATNESGAITAVNIRESETVKPVQSGATVSPEGAVKALSGVGQSTKGTEAVYDYQLLFYIPPKGDGDPVVLLGFAQGLLSAKELP